MMDLALRELAHRHLYDFVKYTWSWINPYQAFRDNWHIGCMCEHLEAMTNLQILRLVMNEPPRHLKSFVVGVFWPVWSWLRNPSSQWIFITYDDELGIRDSGRCRDLIKKPEFKATFNNQWDIKEDFDKKDLFKNTMQGVRMVTTPRGAGLGFDANYVVFDDPHSIKDAKHPNRLREVTEFYSGTITTRGNEPAEMRKLICGARVHENDLSGYVLARDAGYEHLCMPFRYRPRRVYETFAEAKAAGEKYPVVPTSLQKVKPGLRDPRKQEGELIHAERFPPHVVKEWEAELSSELLGIAAAQLDQAPETVTGTIFRRDLFRRYKVMYSNRLGEKAFVLERPNESRLVVGFSECRFFQTIDTALTAKDTSAYTAVATWAITPRGQLLVYNVWRGHLTVPFQYPALEALSYGPITWHVDREQIEQAEQWPFMLLFQAIENKASGPGLIQLGIAGGKPFKVLNPGTDDKIVRSSSLATLYYAGSVYHPVAAEWLEAYESELVSFPNGTAADQVDIASYAGMLLKQDEILRRYLTSQIIAVDETDYSEARESDQTFTFSTRGGDVEIDFGN